MKPSRRQCEIEARKAADPIAQAIGRDDIDYESDELPTAPRVNMWESTVVAAKETGAYPAEWFTADDESSDRQRDKE